MSTTNQSQWALNNACWWFFILAVFSSVFNTLKKKFLAFFYFFLNINCQKLMPFFLGLLGGYYVKKTDNKKVSHEIHTCSAKKHPTKKYQEQFQSCEVISKFPNKILHSGGKNEFPPITQKKKKREKKFEEMWGNTSISQQKCRWMLKDSNKGQSSTICQGKKVSKNLQS